MTDWDARDIELDLSFLGDGSWNVTISEDGVNAVEACPTTDDSNAESLPGSKSRFGSHPEAVGWGDSSGRAGTQTGSGESVVRKRLVNTSPQKDSMKMIRLIVSLLALIPMAASTHRVSSFQLIATPNLAG